MIIIEEKFFFLDQRKKVKISENFIDDFKMEFGVEVEPLAWIFIGHYYNIRTVLPHFLMCPFCNKKDDDDLIVIFSELFGRGENLVRFYGGQCRHCTRVIFFYGRWTARIADLI